jgi:hypothetical protein
MRRSRPTTLIYIALKARFRQASGPQGAVFALSSLLWITYRI